MKKMLEGGKVKDPDNKSKHVRFFLGKKFEIVRLVTEYFKNAGYKVNDVDGVRVIFDDGFGLLRASNTQPALVQRYEAQTQARLDEIMELIQSKLKEIEDNL